MKPVAAEYLIPGFNALPDEVKDELLVQGLRLGSTAILLAFSWFIGQRIIAYWEFRKRLRESDLEAESTFQRIHGEFKALWRIYKVYTKTQSSLEVKDPQIWTLIERSSLLEGEWEALLLKIASNRKLSDKDLTDLGLLRQLIQQLREGIKRSQPLDEDFRAKDYQLFHNLSAEVLEILRRPHQSQNSNSTARQMEKILAVKPGDLDPHRS